MALFHLSVTQTKRSAGQSAIASAAYRAGERLYSEYYGEYSDYTRKGGVICSDILLPSHAPPEYADRQTLWNAVEKAERGKKAQLAYSFDIALQNEFSLEENIALARQFLLENFVSRGMVVDFAVHQPDREDGGIPNPHFHVLCPIRPIEQNGKWGLKQRRVYELDEDGNRIRDANGKYVFNAVPTTDWGSPETLEYWRQTWAEMCNAKFAEKGLDVRILNVYENIVLPVELDGDTVDQKFLDEIVHLLGLEDKLKNMPNNLSGGQQQRVAIARALITKPAIVLADEPTGNLDSKTSTEVLGLIKRTSAEFRQTVVMITHNNDIARLADRIVRIEDGKIVE